MGASRAGPVCSHDELQQRHANGRRSGTRVRHALARGDAPSVAAPLKALGTMVLRRGYLASTAAAAGEQYVKNRHAAMRVVTLGSGTVASSIGSLPPLAALSPKWSRPSGFQPTMPLVAYNWRPAYPT